MTINDTANGGTATHEAADADTDRVQLPGGTRVTLTNDEAPAVELDVDGGGTVRLTADDLAELTRLIGRRQEHVTRSDADDRRYRQMLRVLGMVDGPDGLHVHVSVPGWNTRRTVMLPADLLPADLLADLHVAPALTGDTTTRLFAHVRLSAERAADLDPTGPWELHVTHDRSDNDTAGADATDLTLRRVTYRTDGRRQAP